MTFDLTSYRDDFATAYEEVTGLHMLRFVWKNVLMMVNSQPALPPHELVNYWLQVTYTRTLAVGIRRQAEATDIRPTIGSLLRRVKAHADQITREACEFPDELDGWSGGRDGWLHFAPSTADALDPGTAAKQLDALAAATNVAKRWVNTRVAHYDRAAVEQMTFGDLEGALEGIRDATRYLFRLLNQGSYLSHITPSIPPGWLKSFSLPWWDPETMTMIPAETLG
jgi:hypothetical protein